MRNASWLWASLLLIGVCTQTGYASEADIRLSQRPKIGLALSGGGARGAAHVGVLKILEQMRIPIDYIAGTSMGSIIGGLYASGMTPEQIENALKHMDWEHIFNDDPPRADRSFRRKLDDYLYLVKAKPGISDDGELKFPTGAIQGQKFDLALRELALPVSTLSDFDRLYIPFRAVASDISNGQPVVLGSGDLATAMRASMAVPGAFAAVQIDGKLLVDGGITNNIPIDVVRQMGADIVIAIDISSPYLPAEEVNNIISITEQLTSILTRSNADRNIASLTGRDVLIVPDLGDITSGDFERSAEAIASGLKAAQAKQNELVQLSLSEPDYRKFLAAHTPRPADKLPIVHFLRIENNSTVSDDMIRNRLHQPIGEPLDLQQMERDIGNVYGLELFESVQYDIVEEDGESGVVVNARARSWGPNYLQFGLELSNDWEGDSSYNFGVTYQRTGINSLNGEIRIGLQLGGDPVVIAEWYQPLDPLSRYFVNTKISYGSYGVSVYTEDGDHEAEYQVSESKLDLALGREFSVFGEGRIGYRYRSGNVDLQTGTPGWPEFDYETGQVYGRLWVDRLDDVNFPNHGWSARLEYAAARDEFGSDADFDQFTASASSFTTFGDGHVVGVGAIAETTLDGSAAVQNRYRFGGFLNLSGYVEDSLSGQQVGMLGAVYYRRFTPLPFLSWYVGGSLEYGGVWEDKDDFGDDPIAAGSLFLGADTPIGPVYLGFGVAEGGHNAAFFRLGRPLFQ